MPSDEQNKLAELLMEALSVACWIPVPDEKKKEAVQAVIVRQTGARDEYETS